MVVAAVGLLAPATRAAAPAMRAAAPGVRGTPRFARLLGASARRSPPSRSPSTPARRGRRPTASTCKVYEILASEKVPATIFTSGHWVDGHAAEMAELARDPLISFGDHSYDHPHMSRLPAARVGDEIDHTETALGRYGKKSVAFRPPFGDWNRRVVEVVRARGLSTVTWDVVSGDPSKKTTKAGMIRNVVDHARPGSIVIFHINGRGWRTAEALPEILSGLRARGLRFVSLAALLALGPPVTGPSPPVSSATFPSTSSHAP